LQGFKNHDLINKLKEVNAKWASSPEEWKNRESEAELANRRLAQLHQQVDVEIKKLSDSVFDHNTCYFEKNIECLNRNLIGSVQVFRNWRYKTNDLPLHKALNAHTGSVNSLTVLNDGSIVSGSADRSVKIWDPETETLKMTITGHTDWIQALVILNDGSIASGSGDDSIKIWSPTTGSLIRTLKGHSNSVNTLAVFKDGRLASGSNDFLIKIWNPTTGALLNNLAGHSDNVRALAILKDGKRLVSGSDDDNLTECVKCSPSLNLFIKNLYLEIFNFF